MQMKIRISTLVLLTAIVCIGTGWLVDRNSHQSQLKSLLDGSAVHDRACMYDILANWSNDQPDVILGQVNDQHLKCVLELYRYSSDVDRFSKFLDSNYKVDSNYTAASLAGQLLETMDCSTADEYFDRAGKTSFSSAYSEYIESGTQEHTSFRCFVEGAIGDPSKGP